MKKKRNKNQRKFHNNSRLLSEVTASTQIMCKLKLKRFPCDHRWRRRRHGNVQHRQVDQRLCSLMHEVLAWEEMASLSEHQEHHPEEVWRTFQGHLHGSLPQVSWGLLGLLLWLILPVVCGCGLGCEFRAFVKVFGFVKKNLPSF